MEPVSKNAEEGTPIASPQHAPSSEVGSAVYWCQLLDQQNQITLRMIEVMQGSKTPAAIQLPDFNPDLPDDEPRSWCSTVDICLAEHPMEGGTLIIALSTSLKGSASSWLSQVSHTGMTWSQFKSLFLARYDCTETCAATIINANNSRPKEGENLAVYASRLITSLLVKWKDMNAEEIAVSYVLAHLSQIDNRINRLAFTTEIKTRTKLIQEVQAFSLKRKQDRYLDNFTLDTKRVRANTSNSFLCNYCHKSGHKAIDCRVRKLNQAHSTQRNSTITTSTSSDAKKNVTCFRCGEGSHVAPRCPKGSGTAGGNGAGFGASSAAHERRVNFCQIQGVRGELKESECVAVNIKRIEVPSLVEVGVDSVILDCEYNVSSVAPDSGLVMKWFFNGSSGLVYQWIPPLRPQVIGLLKGKVDMNFRISEEPLQAYRAIKILKPSTHLSGNYTCVVSTFMEEDRQTKSMLVYSSGKGFHFYQEKKYVFWVTLICVAKDLYPRPEIAILSHGIPLKQAETEITMDSWGMYSVTVIAVVHDDDVTSPWEEFVCTLTLPPANITFNTTTVYYPGLMPTAYIAAVEMEKHQERQANGGRVPASFKPHVLYSLLLLSSRFL